MRMRILRNLARRKLRTGLTIAGIAIGIWALVVFSAMAAKVNGLVEGATVYYSGKVIVSSAAREMGEVVPIDASLANRAAALDGVSTAVPLVTIAIDPDGGHSMMMGDTNVIVGSDPDPKAAEPLELRAIQGRLLESADAVRDVVVLGADLARTYEKGIGEEIELRGRPFQVVGILAPTLTVPDTTAYVPLAAAQDLLATQLAEDETETTIPESHLATHVIVYPTPVTAPSDLAPRVKEALPDVATVTSDDVEKDLGSSMVLFNAIIFGVALISLVVGGLSVINTMAMSVQERTREIGIKRAIGGSRGRVVRELVAEAGVIGLIGGLIGLALGAVAVFAANEAGRASGNILFLLTGGSAVFAVAFSTLLGMAAGIVPAWSAARLDPVSALRHD
jgi:putative ABC transport system permease protein